MPEFLCRLKQSETAGALHGLHTIGNLKFFIDIIEMEIDCTLTDKQHIRHLFTGVTFHDQRQDFQFTLGKSHSIGGLRSKSVHNSSSFKFSQAQRRLRCAFDAGKNMNCMVRFVIETAASFGKGRFSKTFSSIPHRVTLRLQTSYSTTLGTSDIKKPRFDLHRINWKTYLLFP